MTTLEFTPDVVRNTKFRDKMRGYHPEEVQAFVERAAAALDELQRQLAEVTARAAQAEAALAANAENDGMLRRTLTLAEKTAELAIGEAHDESERIRLKAHAAADLLKTATDDECRQRIAEAEETRQAARAEASTLVEQAEHAANELLRAAETAIAARAKAAEGELEASLANLVAQRSELQGQVSGLGAYLADERARILSALNEAIETFGSTLVPAERSTAVLSALEANTPVSAIVMDELVVTSNPSGASLAFDDVPWASAEPATTTWSAIDPPEPADSDEDSPHAESPSATSTGGDIADPSELDGAGEEREGSDVGRQGAMSVESDARTVSDGSPAQSDVTGSDLIDATAPVEELRPPSTLLFTFDGDRRHADGERRRTGGDRSEAVAVETKPRRASRGRRSN
jgi:DivIVA domain-containing protein